VDTKEVILSEFMMYLSVKLGTKSGTANSALAGVKTLLEAPRTSYFEGSLRAF
jgi:hypothetical protein